MRPEVDVQSTVARDRVWVSSETGALRRVVIGSPAGFVMPEPINRKQRKYPPGHPERPREATLRPEFDALHGALVHAGVEVVVVDRVDEAPDQLTPRDIAFVVDDILVIAAMAYESRRAEWRGIRSIMDALPAECVARAPQECVVEGGDVILDRGMLYVGMAQRTTAAGVDFLRERFGGRYEVVPVDLARADDEPDVLHLDCTFVPVGDGFALICPDGFHTVPEPIRENYQWLEVTREEQDQLATNVLVLSTQRVISRTSSVRVNAMLRDVGIEVTEVTFREWTKSGGAFRCASLPLVRD